MERNAMLELCAVTSRSLPPGTRLDLFNCIDRNHREQPVSLQDAIKACSGFDPLPRQIHFGFTLGP